MLNEIIAGLAILSYWVIIPLGIIIIGIAIISSIILPIIRFIFR